MRISDWSSDVCSSDLVVVDAVYDELTSDLSYPKDRAVKAFIDGNQPPFIIENTEIGEQEREKRRAGKKLKKNAGELAIVDFMSSDDGLRKYVSVGEPVVILFEDTGIRVFNKQPTLHQNGRASCRERVCQYV